MAVVCLQVAEAEPGAISHVVWHAKRAYTVDAAGLPAVILVKAATTVSKTLSVRCTRTTSPKQ